MAVSIEALPTLYNRKALINAENEIATLTLYPQVGDVRNI